MFKRINIWLLVLCLTAYSVSSPIKKQPKRNGQVRVTGRIRCYLYPQAAVYANQYPIT